MADISMPYTDPTLVPTPSASNANLFWDLSGTPKLKYPNASTIQLGLSSGQTQKLTDLFFHVKADYNAKVDARTVFDGAATASTQTITSGTILFTSADVGKLIILSGAGVNGAQLSTTITAVTDSSHATVTATISTTVSGKGLTVGTDDTTAIQNAINAAQTAKGGIVFFPPGRALITSTLVVSGNGVSLMGSGSGYTSDTGDYTVSGGSWIVWGGSSSGIAVQAAPNVGAAAQALESFRFLGLNIDCRNGDQNQALIGLQMLSCHGYHVEDFFIIDALTCGMDLNVVSQLGEARDVTRGKVSRGAIRQLDNPSGTLGSTTTTGTGNFTTASFTLAITSNANFTTTGWAWVGCSMGYSVLVQYTNTTATSLTGCTITAAEAVNAPAWIASATVVQAVPGNAMCIRLDGDTLANACCSWWDTLQLSHAGTSGVAAIEFKNSDSQTFSSVYINRASGTNFGIRFNGSNTNATLSARNNVFLSSSAGVGGVIARSSGITNGAQDNYWVHYQTGNGEPVPISESAVGLKWSLNGSLVTNYETALGNISLKALSTSTAAIGNTETQVIGVSIPANVLQVGSTFLIKAFGLATNTTGASTSTFRARMGTVTLTGNQPASAAWVNAITARTNVPIEVEILVTVQTIGTSGTAIGQVSVTGGSTGTTPPTGTTAAVTVNTTVTNILEFTFISGASTTTAQFTNAVIQRVA